MEHTKKIKTNTIYYLFTSWARLAWFTDVKRGILRDRAAMNSSRCELSALGADLLGHALFWLTNI